MSPCIIFCTTCKGRTQHIEQTLPRNIADNVNYENCKFVILDYNSNDGLVQLLKDKYQKYIDNGKVIVYHYTEDHPFQMAHAKNMVHRLGILEGADILVNMDADNFTGAGFASFLAAEMIEKNFFMWSKMILHGEERLPRGISGRIAVTKAQFLNVGGYDEKYDTWSPDDKDFNARLCRIGYEAKEVHPRFLDAILHNDKMRFREYKHAQVNMGESQFAQIHDCDDTVVNFGHLGEGIVFRNFDFSDPIYLGPIPTRIFGIGMHKTATTSLYHALSILGFDCAHWKNAHWAKRLYNEMMTGGRSATLEQSYALCDLPITVLFKELDKGYPGSKFILTLKSEEKWLDSVEKHWNSEHNKFRVGWDTDPFTNKIHRIVYGRKKFDKDIMLNRYRQHNEEVREYFKDRYGDLLSLNVDNGGGWDELCGFLGQKVPSESYPHVMPY